MAAKSSTPSGTRKRRKDAKYPPGFRQTPEYGVFNAARQRCNDPNCLDYKNYGGRGIKFRFADYNEFMAELGPRPSAAHTLDRINNDGHYEKGNVRWATRKQQTLNRRPKQFCKHGHPFSGDNLGWSKGRRTIGRRCLICHREAERRRRGKKTGGVR